MPPGVRVCSSRRVSSGETDEALLFVCQHSDAQKVEFHTLVFNEVEELSGDMTACPEGYSL